MNVCPIPFVYAISQVRPGIVRLDIDRDLADLAGVRSPSEYFTGPNAWDYAVKAAQQARGLFYESWSDAHGAIAEVTEA